MEVSVILIFFFFYKIIYLAVPSLSCGTRDRYSLLRYVGSSSLTRDQTWAPSIEIMES